MLASAAMLHRFEALSLDVESHVTGFNQLEFFISAWHNYAIQILFLASAPVFLLNKFIISIHLM